MIIVLKRIGEKIRTKYNASAGYMRICQYYNDLFQEKNDISKFQPSEESWHLP